MDIGTGRRVVGCALLAGQLWSCTSWRVSEVAPRQLVEEQAPSRVRVTRANGTKLILANPKLQGDTLYGSDSTGATRGAGVPLADVKQVAVRRGDGLKTVGLVLGTAVVVAGVGLAIIVASIPEGN